MNYILKDMTAGSSRYERMTSEGKICHRCEILLTSRFAAGENGIFCGQCLKEIEEEVVHRENEGTDE